MSYQKTQWKALESISSNQHKHLDNLDELYEIFTEIGRIEKVYSDSLTQLEKRIKSLNDFGTMGIIFNLVAKNIKLKKEQHLILERIIKTIFSKDQLTVLQNDQFRNQIQSHKEILDYNEMVKCIENSKNDYHNCLQNIEKIFSEELIKVTSSEIEPEMFTKTKNELIEIEKKARITYCEKINEGNLTRDNYEEQMNIILKGCQKTDELYLLTCSNNISTYFVNEKEVYKKLSESAFEIKNLCDKMDVQYEIEQYCKRNNRHGKPPSSFNLEVYSPSFNYFPQLNANGGNNGNTASDNLKQKSQRAILKEFFNKNFGYYPPEGINDQQIIDNYKILESFVSDIWISKCNEKLFTKIDTLLHNRKMRFYFLKMLNQSRLKLSSLSDQSFNIIIHLMQIVLNESMKTIPIGFESIHLIIILSQTFYKTIANEKGEETQIFLQSEIMKEMIWQNRVVWDGLIEYNFETEMNNDINVQTFSLEEKIIKEQSTIMIILTTFNFIMSSFGYEKKEIQELIKAYCLRFNIEEENIKSIEA